jgi:hypothetical protein
METMTCPACRDAEADPETVIKYMGCMSCDARSVAQSPQAKARHADPSVLQALMRRVWPDRNDYAKGRTLTWEWIKRLEAEREKA